MARIPAVAVLAATLLLALSLDAQGASTHESSPSVSTHRKVSTHRASLGRGASLDPASLAMALAERYWGAVPCQGQLSILLNRPLAAGLGPSTDAWVTFNSSLGPNDLEAPAGTYTQCTISVAHWQWPTRAAIDGDWNMFCLTIVHEVGHLLGHPHSLAPGSVMAPVFTDEANVPAICRTAGPSG